MHIQRNSPFIADYVYWSEIHYEEKGRYVICSADRKTGEQHPWTPINFSARTTVHEYGGGDFFVYDGAVFFSNFNDQVLYKQTSPSSTPEPVTDTTRKWRYADGIFCSKVKNHVCGCELDTVNIISNDTSVKTFCFISLHFQYKNTIKD